EVILSSGPSQNFENISQGGRWVQDYNETAQVILKTPVRADSIRLLRITMKPSAGSIDVWHIMKVWTKVVVGNGTPGGSTNNLFDYNRPPNDPFKLQA